MQTLGSLSNRDGDADGKENATLKVNSRCFKLHHYYSISFDLSDVGEYFKGLYAAGSKTGNENRCLAFT